MTRAAVYLRISQDQTGEQAGVTRQREDCLDLVDKQEWELAEVYTDNDISASTGRARPGYLKMLADIRDGQIDAVVAWHPDRLYRKLTDLEGLIKAIDKNDVIMRTVRAGEIDLSTPTGRMLARILSATAQAEGEVKADRWRRSWKQGREAGKWFNSGTRLFGYTRDGDIDQDEANVARQIADKINNGEPILGVCRWLQTQGIKGTRGADFTPAAVKAYLLTPTIAGWASLDGQIVAEGDWDPVIDKEIWEGVRAMLTARTRPYVAKVSSLTKLIECAACGTKMITSGYTRNGVSIRSYRCTNRPGINGCGKVSGKAEPIEEIVYAYARERLADERIRKRIGELRAEPTQAQSELANLELRVAELEAELSEPDVPVKAILSAIERTKDRQAELLDNLAARNLEPLPVGDEWPDDIRRRRALVDLVVKNVVLLPWQGKGGRLGFDESRVLIEGR